MAFLPKEELYERARELGISTEGISFAKLQGLVSKALAGTDEMASPNKGNSYQLSPVDNKKVVGKAHVVGRPKPKIGDFIKSKEVFAPELKLNAHQFFGFEEIVGDQPRDMTDPFSEMRLNLGHNTSDNNPEMSATPAIKTKTGKKVVAKTGMPHGNAEIYVEADAPAGLFSARFGNEDGYVWSNQSPIAIVDPSDPSKYVHVHVRGVKDVLEELDRTSEWLDKCEQYQRYAFNIKIINKAFVRSMLRTIINDIKKEKKLNGE